MKSRWAPEPWAPSATGPSTWASLPRVVSIPGSTTSISASPDPSVFGHSATFTAIVTAVGPATGIPTGTRIFFNGETPLGEVPLVIGVAEFQTSTLAAGGYSITAGYSGDVRYSPATSATSGSSPRRPAPPSPPRPLPGGRP